MKEIQLTRGYVALVDDEDYESLIAVKWHFDEGCALRVIPDQSRRGKMIKIFMHRQLLGLEAGDSRKGEHINGNRVDNQKTNLRVIHAKPITQYRKQHICAACGIAFIAENHTSTVCGPECRFVFYTNKADGCWNWSGPKINGYGRLFLDVSKDGKRISIGAHRYSLNRIGIETPANMVVMHSCDNPACVNPDHLSVGTLGDNNRDRSAKGRSGSRVYSDEDRKRHGEQRQGEKNAMAKLTEEKVRAIRKDSRGCQAVANEYGVSKKLVLNIRHRRAWAHVQD